MTGIRCGQDARSYDDIRVRAARIATGLAAHGVAAGDRVALYLRNDIAFVEASMGIGILGAIPVPVNWHWKGAELDHLLTDSGSGVVFAHTDLVATVESVPGERLLIEVPIRDAAPTGRHLPSRTGWPVTNPGPSRRRRRRTA